MNISREEHAVSMTPNTFVRFITISLCGLAAMRARYGRIFADADVDMDFLPVFKELCAFDVPRFF